MRPIFSAIDAGRLLLEEARKRGMTSPNPSSKEGSSPAEKEQRRLKVAIGKLLAAQGKIKADGWGIVEWDTIIGVACRAAKVSRFNDIPLSKCRGLIYEFNKQREAIEGAREYVNNNQ